MLLAAAFFWGTTFVAQILGMEGLGPYTYAASRFARMVDAIELCRMEMLIGPLGSALLAVCFEICTWAALSAAALPIGYAGILSCGVAYTCQILGQATVAPTQAAILMSMEAVFAALTGWAVLGETMSAVQLLCCALLLGGAVMAQTAPKVGDQ